MSTRNTPDFLGTRAEEPVPTADDVKGYLASLADAFGLPRPLIHAVAQTESAFEIGRVRRNPETTGDFGPEGRSYGLMQVRQDHIGQGIQDADGKPFQIAEEIKTDWQANAQAGVALLAQQYQLAELENPFGSLEEWAQQAYSGYSAGTPPARPLPLDAVG